MESTAILVLNWNNAAETISCLGTLVAHLSPDTRIIVVDNGSTDGSAPRIREAFPEIELLDIGSNLGYAGGNNVGIRFALDNGAELVCIMNNDITVESNFLAPLTTALREQPTVGVVTPLVAERVKGETVWALGSVINWRTAAVRRCYAGQPVGALRQRESFDVEIASGATMLVRREVFERVGLLDESFFLYYEEVDWCLRARQVGFRILSVPSSVVWHKVSATLGPTSPVIDYYMLRNHLLLVNRHMSGAHRLRALMMIVLRNLATVIAYTVKPRRGSRVANRNARLFALRDAVLGHWGVMGPDVARSCRQG